MNPVREKRERSGIFLVDDHPVVLAALTGVIERQADFEICGHAAAASACLRAVAACRPDLVLIALSLKHCAAWDLIEDLRARHRDLRILAVSDQDDLDTIWRALAAGARGVFLVKQDSMRNFVPAIRDVLAGKRYFTPPLQEMVLNRLLDGAAVDSPWASLSNQEVQVVKWLAQGWESRDIAAALHVTEDTVRTVYARLKKKLGVTTERQFIVAAVRLVLSPRR